MQLQLAFFTFLLSSYPILVGGEKENIMLQILHLYIALVCSFSLFQYKNRPYSLYKMVHIFFLFFLCVAPIMQYKNNVTLWGGNPFNDTDYIITSFIVLFVILLYNLIYSFVYHNRNNISFDKIVMKFSNPIVVEKPVSVKEGFLFVLLAIFVLYLLLCLNNYNLFALFFRGSDLEGGKLLEITNDVKISQSASLIIVNFFRPMGVILFLCVYQLGIKSKFLLVVFALLMVLIAFPMAMPRFCVAALYIPFLLSCFAFMKKTNVFVLCCILGLLVVFPFLNNFRHFKAGQELLVGLDFEMFLEGHFDSYSSLLRVVTNNIVTYGNQLLGCFFFWLPRSIWITKPIGSGAFISEQLHLNFDNISCCYLGEGYINGGLVGLLLFVIVLAVVTAALDNAYWNIAMKKYMNSYFDLLYFLLLGLLFFMLRGDLLSSVAFTIGFLASAISIYFMLYALRKYKLVIRR